MSSNNPQTDSLVRELEAKLFEQQQTIERLTAEVESLSARIAQSSRGSESREEIVQLETKLQAATRRNELLMSELSMRSDELARIERSPGWRLLNRYGRIKYRYLLPVYRALRLPPYGFSRSRAPRPQQHSRDTDDEERRPAEFAKSNAHDILCLPIIEWGFRIQRPQHLMFQFAAAGHRVFYVSPTFRSAGPPYEITQRATNVFEVSLRGPELNVYTEALNTSACETLLSSLDALRQDLRLAATAAILQLPFWWPLAREARARFAWPVIYDCMDEHSGFRTNSPSVVEREEELVAHADLVIASSIVLQEKIAKKRADVLLVQNACDFEHFSRVQNVESERPTIGYYGAISDWFDSDLVATIAERRPEWDFILVGSTLGATINRLSRQRNVRLVGERPYSEIPEWLAKFDVAIIPFKRMPLTEATSPVKAYEILASGKPLVSVPIPEMRALSDIVRLASTAEEFEARIAEALGERDPASAERRRLFARNHTWERRHEQISPAICNAFPRASIIVVTYNNVHLNRLCIESIYDRTEWPNFEVIVVDNGSGDETPQFLGEAQRSRANLRVVFNKNNLGFAAANNIGLREATGEYLVLLNNDTVVTRGWLSALIRHLHVHPEVGLIGPVSNAINNEAKVEAGYSTLDEMPSWAAAYAAAHDSQLFEIPMLAMFCVAMRREVFLRAGFLDEQFGIGMFEDDDYCRRVRELGYEIRCARDSFVHHWQRASFLLLGEDEYIRIFDENKKKFQDKWRTASRVSSGSSTGEPEHRSSAEANAGVLRVAAPTAPQAESARHTIQGSADSQAAAATARKTKGRPSYAARFPDAQSIPGRCNVCGKQTEFYYSDPALYRESLACGQCLATSRYRSIARGILRAIREKTGIEAESVADLARRKSSTRVAIYDSQTPLYFGTSAYPIPDLLSKCSWIDLEMSVYRPDCAAGERLGQNVTNQNLESLTYPDSSFDIVITSDVMEHVRLDHKAHREIQRVLKRGGIYVFTVPHFRDKYDTFYRVAVSNPEDPATDTYLTEKEYHGDGNSPGGRSLSYRAYGTDLDDMLKRLGFDIEYSRQDFPEYGILNTELFYCRVSK